MSGHGNTNLAKSLAPSLDLNFSRFHSSVTWMEPDGPAGYAELFEFLYQPVPARLKEFLATGFNSETN